jgi:hypothetical protein
MLLRVFCLHWLQGTLTWTQSAPYLETLSLINITAPAGTALPVAWGNVSGMDAFPSLKTLQLDNIPAMEGPLPSSWLTGFPALRNLLLKDMPLLGLTVQLGDWVDMMQGNWRWTPPPSVGTEAQLQLSGVGLSGAWPPNVVNNCWYVRGWPCLRFQLKAYKHAWPDLRAAQVMLTMPCSTPDEQLLG